jgi:hypothetical protein
MLSTGKGTAMTEGTGKLTEGWGVIRPGDRRAHYYDADGFSLCRRVGFYNGPLDPDNGPSPDDHKECRTLLDRRKAKAARGKQ